MSARAFQRERGQIVYLLLAFSVSLFMGILLVIAVGQAIYEKLTLQRAVDAAAVSAATWQARGLNIIADLNFALVAAGAGDLAKIASGDINFEAYRALLEAQETATKVFPGAAGWHYRQVFEANTGEGGGRSCWPLPTGMKDVHMFSLRLRRKEINFLGIEIKLWMEKDRPNFWDPPTKTGPFIRLVARREERPWFKVSAVFGKNIPAVSAVAQAAALDGGLWDPRFRARLIPVSTDLPGVDNVILH